MGAKNPVHSDEETTRLIEFFAAFVIPTENMRASPGVLLEDGWLRLSPEFVWKVEDLTDEQLDAIEKTLRVRLKR